MLTFSEKLKNKSDIYSFMCDHGRTLSSKTDFSFEIKIEHLDGSKFDLKNCSWDECEEKIYIWTEHCGYFYFYKDDLREMEYRIDEWDEKEGKFQVIENTITKFNYDM